jgi:hypothetical protein
VLLINIGIVLYMVSLRVHARHHLTGPADGRDVEEDVSTRVPG